MKTGHIDDLVSRGSKARSRRSLLRGAAGGALGGALALPGSNRVAARTTTKMYPLSWDVYNTCRDELVLINGTVHIQTHVTSKNGHLLYRSSTRSQGVSGDSTLGSKYVYRSEEGDLLNTWTEGGFFLSKQRVTMKLMRSGEDGKGRTGDDLFVYWTVTIATNQSTGEITVREDRYEAECR